MMQRKFIIAKCFFLPIAFGLAQESFQLQYRLEPETHFSYRIEQQDSLLLEDQKTSSFLSWIQYTVRMNLKSKNKPFVTFSLDSIWTLSEEITNLIQDEKAWRKHFQPVSFSSEVTKTGQLLSKNAPFYFFWIPFPDTLLTLNQTWSFHFTFQIKKPYPIAQEWQGTVNAFELLGDSVAVFHFDITQIEKGETIIPEPFRKIIITYEGKAQGTGIAYFHLKKGKIEKVLAALRGEAHLKKGRVSQKYSKISRILVKLL